MEYVYKDRKIIPDIAPSHDKTGKKFVSRGKIVDLDGTEYIFNAPVGYSETEEEGCELFKKFAEKEIDDKF